MVTPKKINLLKLLNSAKIDLELDSLSEFDTVSFTKWKRFHNFINRKSFSHFLVDNKHFL